MCTFKSLFFLVLSILSKPWNEIIKMYLKNRMIFDGNAIIILYTSVSNVIILIKYLIVIQITKSQV